ncbi:hypothetical protein HPB51_025942 [Rhipicephalus microplus]|uniref:Uncharacterized protein n=1 Tax=Rhipicephalus microplus TaxID=6941 RepID=A0A9J6EDR8_RHIMP|nr:hypothetical protein HPB51_025942 [Rhipicephalus microplus]
MSRVPNSECLRIVELSQKQYTQRQTADMTTWSNKTVNRTIQAYKKEGHISDALHKRHPRAMTAAQDDVDICDAAKASLFSTAKEIGVAAGVSASASTRKRRLAEGKLKSHVATQKPGLFLSNSMVQLRKPWTTGKEYFFLASPRSPQPGTKSNVCGTLSMPLRPPLHARSSIQWTHML